MNRLRGQAGSPAPRGGYTAWVGLALALSLTAGPSLAADAAGGSAAADGAPVDAEFDRSMLAGAGRNTTDLSRFEHGNPVLPGVYRVDVYLNGRFVGRTDVRFAETTSGNGATACATPALLGLLGLPLDALDPAVRATLAQPAGCPGFGEVIPGATMAFDQSALRLDATVPQASLARAPRGYVAPEYWDAGVSALRVDYRLNAYRSHTAGLSERVAYLGLATGLNLGAWRFRHDGTLNWRSGPAGQPARHTWQTIDAYAHRDLAQWRAQLTVGDAYTSGELFDSVRLLGLRVASDDRMLPDSLRGYAPTVRGTARSNAQVTVRQNGAVIYQATVPPGPFVIDDLYATGYGGDLQVTVAEADGQVRTFDVPYAAVPQLLRPGLSRFAVSAGVLDEPGLVHAPGVVQATLQRGFSNLWTGYGGVVVAQGYLSGLLGGALNTRYGALALDVTGARMLAPRAASRSGRSVRLSYSKVLPQSGTSLTVATYRYSSSGYLRLRDAMAIRGGAANALATPPQADGLATPGRPLPPFGQTLAGGAPATDLLARQRSRFDLTLNQALGERGGDLHATATARDYWSRRGSDVQFQLGYTNRLGPLSFSLSANRARDLDGRYRNEYFLAFSLPLGDGAHAPAISGNLGRDASRRLSRQVGIAGAAGAENAFSYGATASHVDGEGTAGSVYGGYRASFAQLNASYGDGPGYTQASVGAAGTVVAFPGGISFGQPAGDTVGVVMAPHAQGARITSSPGVRVDRFGHALLPYLTPYYRNTVQIDPQGLPLGVQLAATSVSVAPRAGAVVLLPFKTESGRPLLVQAHLPGGRAVPFGAEVVDGHGQVLGVVGQAGRVLLRGVADHGQLSARWARESEASGRCSFAYRVDPAADRDPSTLAQLQVRCAPAAASHAPESHS